MLPYLTFSISFFAIHLVCYVAAGIIDLQLAKSVYYADFSSAIPFSNTIEGLIYLKHEFVEKRVFWTIQLEAILYSTLFGLLSAWILI